MTQKGADLTNIHWTGWDNWMGWDNWTGWDDQTGWAVDRAHFVYCYHARMESSDGMIGWDGMIVCR